MLALRGPGRARRVRGALLIHRVPLVHPLCVFVRVARGRRTREMLSLVDTGSRYVLIPREDGLTLGYDLARAPRVPLATVGGLVEAPMVVLDEVAVGTATAPRVTAVCYDIPGVQVVSLLGMSFLERFVVRIDVGEATLELRRRSRRP